MTENKLEKVAEILGESIVIVKLHLGVLVPVHKMTTLLELSLAYYKTRRGSKKRNAILEELKKLVLKEIENDYASPLVIDCLNFFSKENYPEYRRELLYRIEMLSLKEIEEAKTIDEIEIACNKTLENSKAQKLGLEKWNALSLKEIEEATTIDEIDIAYSNTLEYSEAEKSACIKREGLILKKIEEATTIEEVVILYNPSYYIETKEAMIKKIYKLL